MLKWMNAFKVPLAKRWGFVSPFALMLIAVLLCMALGEPSVSNAALAERSAASIEAKQSKGASEGLSSFPKYSTRWRFGIGVARERGYINEYDISSLCLGWYHDWSTLYNPPRPDGIEYMQLIRVGPEFFDLNNPSSYNWTSLDAIIRKNPGSVWMIGNEPDGRAPGACDRRSPNEYARIYKIFYDHIKAIDPTAQITNGPIIEPTPLRMDWLTKVWDEYKRLYKTDMPVDIWNIHNQIVKEAPSQGADIPIGCDPALGRNYGIQDNDNLDIFIDHIVRMRQWMKAHGQQNKPLIISEYGILQPEYEGFTRDRINDFMTATFNYLLHAKDTSLGLPEDEYRLVQRWAWFSLNTPLGTGGQGGGWNGNLFDPVTHEITPNGRNYGRIACQSVHPTPTPKTTPRSSFTRREAEDGSTHGTAIRAQISSASDCLYVTNGGDVTFNVYIPTTGNYYIWGRVWGTDYNNKSFGVKVSYYNEVVWYIQPGGWTWSRVSSYNPPIDPMVYRLEGGRWHSITISPRGGGQGRIDVIEVTDNPAYRPSGVPAVCNPTPTSTPTQTRTPTRTATPTVTRTPMPTGPAKIAGRVAYQGRGQPPASSWQAPLIVSAHLPGDPIPAYAFTVTSDENGNFEVPTGILTGTYDVGVRNLHSLRNLRRNVLVSTQTEAQDMGTLLEGDANLDNRVDIFDFAILASAYGTEAGQAGFRAQADFNDDQKIDIFDFALLAGNYGGEGDASPASLAPASGDLAAKPASLGTVTVYIQPSPKTVTVDEVFTVDAYMAAGSNQVMGVEVQVTFDTTYLEVQTLTPGPTLSTVLPGTGISGNTITYNAGVPLGGSPVSGTFKLFTLTIKAKQATASTQLAWGRVKVAAPEGEHTANKNNGTIVILAASPTPTPSNTAVMKRIYGKVTDNYGVGLAGVTVRLHRGDLVNTTTTTTGGFFQFFVSPIAAAHRLVEEDPPGYTSVTATIPSGISGSVIDANTIEFTLPTGSEVGQFIFVDQLSGTVTPTGTPEGTPTITPAVTETPTPTAAPQSGVVDGHVFRDQNGNGRYDEGEGVSGATIELRSMEGSFSATRQSDGEGYYSFASVAPGFYRLQVTALPPQYELVDPAAWAFPLEAGRTLTLDFEVQPKSSYPVFLPVLLKRGP